MDREGRVANVLRAAKERVQGPSHRAFVDAVYRALLWREPDEAGVKQYAGDLNAGRRSRFRVIRDVGQSSEAAKHMMFGPGFREYTQAFTINGSNVDPAIPAVCFLHPMKCGGTALAQGMSKLADPWPRILDVWADQLVCFPRPMLARLRLLTGHLPYGAVEVLPEGTVTVTIVREPVGRTLSHFTPLRTHGGEAGLTLEEFVRVDRWRAVWSDYQARQLAAEVPVGAAWRGDWPGVLQELQDTPWTGTEAELHEQASARLASIDVVGVSNDLDAVMRRVAEVWKKDTPPPLERENTSLVPLRRAEVAADLLAEIEAGTTVDAALYAEAQERAKDLPGA